MDKREEVIQSLLRDADLLGTLPMNAYDRLNKAANKTDSSESSGWEVLGHVEGGAL